MSKLKKNLFSDSKEGSGFYISNIKTSKSNVTQVNKWNRSISLDYGTDLKTRMKKYEILLSSNNFYTNFSSPLVDNELRESEEITKGVRDKAGIIWESTSITGIL